MFALTKEFKNKTMEIHISDGWSSDWFWYEINDY